MGVVGSHPILSGRHRSGNASDQHRGGRFLTFSWGFFGFSEGAPWGGGGVLVLVG